MEGFVDALIADSIGFHRFVRRYYAFNPPNDDLDGVYADMYYSLGDSRDDEGKRLGDREIALAEKDMQNFEALYRRLQKKTKQQASMRKEIFGA